MLRERIQGIEIITAPESKASPELAEKWIGVRIPLPQGFNQEYKYHVDARTALKQLAKKDLVAAKQLAEVYGIDFTQTDQTAIGWMLWTFALHECKLVDMTVDHDYT